MLMRVLITGATGFIGRNLVEGLAEQFDLVTPTHAELDLLDESAVTRFQRDNRVDATVHCATKPGHRNAKDPTGLVAANTRMLLNLTRNREACGRLLLLTSGAVYDQRHYAPKMREDRVGMHVPVDETGYSKYVCARLVELMDDAIELRPFGVFGPHEDWEIRFISNAICKALSGLPITLRQDRRFDYVWVGDLVEVIRRLLVSGPRRGAFNVTPDEAVSLLDVARMVREACRADVEIRVGTSGLGVEYSGDNGQLRRVCPELKLTPLRQAIAQLRDWYSARLDTIDPALLHHDK